MRIVSGEQLKELASFCFDIAKGLVLGAVAVPVAYPIEFRIIAFISLKAIVSAIFFVFLGLKFLEEKEVRFR